MEEEQITIDKVHPPPSPHCIAKQSGPHVQKTVLKGAGKGAVTTEVVYLLNFWINTTTQLLLHGQGTWYCVCASAKVDASPTPTFCGFCGMAWHRKRPHTKDWEW